MTISEDHVKKALTYFLESTGFTAVDAKYGTSQGYDVEAISPHNGRKLVIECKGEALTGNQHHRSWPNVASALLTSIRESENPDTSHAVAMAFPDTSEYKGRMEPLRSFCQRENIAVYWVSSNGSVKQW